MSCGRPLSPAAPPTEGTRKVVTILFCDVAGFTPMGERLDPETLGGVMTAFYERMAEVVERHGGTVEKYIGDAVMAVFGVPLLHEDDALRAVRAAVEMLAALEGLNAELDAGARLQLRIGVNTGEVIVGDPSAGRSLVLGDAVNVAARLEHAAPTGGVLIGRDTYALVRDAVTVDPGEPLALKGKEHPVMAHRLVSVLPGAQGTARPTPQRVDRDSELAALDAILAATLSERSCELICVLGSAGVGKSRLAHDFSARAARHAVVLEGRCLPYGEGITFWPVAQIVKQACGISEADPRRRALTRIEQTLAGADDAELVAERIAGAIGFVDAGGEIQETFWAIRRFFEWLARDRPVVAVFDDVQWAEPTLLDLLEYLAGWSRDGSLMLLCLARPDLLDLRPAWGSPASGRDVLLLHPLTTDDSEQLIRNILGSAELERRAVGRITEAAGGNPLFVEEMLRMLEDDGLLRQTGSGWDVVADLSAVAVPASIGSLLSTRLDRLSGEERSVIGSAAVIGKEFWWAAVAELVPERVRPAVGAHLQTLVRKDLVRPHRSTLPGQDAFAFHHLLIQEAAYQATPKQTRAVLHERFAGWIERTVGERVVEYEEVLGFHLERAAMLQRELGPSTADVDLARRAGERLGSAGRRALGRGDMPAAAELLRHAVEVLPPDDAGRTRILLDLAQARLELGDLAEAERTIAAADAAAADFSDRGARAQVAVLRLLIEESTDPKDRSSQALEELRRVIPVFEELGDHLGLSRAWRLMADVHWTRARYAEVDAALRRAIEHARRVGDQWEEAESLGQYTGSGVYGPAPAAEVARRSFDVLATVPGNRIAEARALRSLAIVRAMEGSFDEARDLVRRARTILEDLGMRLRAAFVSEGAAFIERLAGDHAAAERELRSGFETARDLGEQGFQSTAAALLARELIEQGRFDEAERFIALSEDLTADDDLATQVLWRSARELLLAARGALDEAEAMAREAVKLADETDDLNMRADVLMDLSRVVEAAGRAPEAHDAVRQAIALYRDKGNRVASAAAERRMAELAGRR
jgi:predicted ATPase/class 3 adenylate cyclase